MINDFRSKLNKLGFTSLCLATLTFSAGCSSNPEQETAEAGPPWPPTDGAVVHVRFTVPPGKSELCPDQVVEFSVDLNKGTGKNKYIYWRALQYSESEGEWIDLEIDYDIYFDPFKKADAKPFGGDDGLLRSEKLDEDSPNGVFYKYTVMRDTDDCRGNPLDPFVRVF